MGFLGWLKRRRTSEWGYGTFPLKNSGVGNADRITGVKEVELSSGRKLYITHVETDLPVSWLHEKQR